MFITKAAQKEIVRLVYGGKRTLIQPRLGFVEVRDGRLYAVDQKGEIGLSYPVDKTDGPVWFSVEAIKAAKPQGNMIWVDDDKAVEHDVLVSKAFYGCLEAAELCKIPTNFLCHYVWSSLPIVALKVGKNLQVASHSSLSCLPMSTSTYPAIVPAKVLIHEDEDTFHYFGQDLLQQILDEDTIAISFPRNRIAAHQRNGDIRVLARIEVTFSVEDPSFRWIG